MRATNQMSPPSRTPLPPPSLMPPLLTVIGNRQLIKMELKNSIETSQTQLVRRKKVRKISSSNQSNVNKLIVKQLSIPLVSILFLGQLSQSTHSTIEHPLGSYTSNVSALISHNNATITSATSTSNAVSGANVGALNERPNQSDNLKMKLNESLSKFIHATGQAAVIQRQNHVNHRQQHVVVDNSFAHQKQPQHDQQHQQSSQLAQTALKKISCEELSLVVLAQRVLNISSSSGAISRLIECKQENLLDLNGLEILNQRSSGQMASAATYDDEDLDESAARRRNQASRVDQIESTRQADANFIRATSDTEQISNLELHLGAKIAISLLLATITLVSVATLVDYQTNHTKLTGTNWKDASNNGRLLFGRRENKGLRDYRSLSMSSNCSSNLFCSTSSVASSTIETSSHLNASNQLHPLNDQNSNSKTPSPQPPSLSDATDSASNQHNYHYDSNLQLHINESEATNLNNGKSLIINMSSVSQLHAPDSKQIHSSHSRQMNYIKSKNNDDQSSQQRKSQQHNNHIILLKQLLFAFSLRQSVKQIIGSEPVVRKSNHCDRSIESHNIKLCDNKSPDIASIREQVLNETRMKRNQINSSNAQRESVDSLHGLRFLSMIWVIVIHSYNFALRWMFFSNTTTLDSIYKSTASQLIANGSFACDSFFFAGGFLLPYLAFPSQQSTSSPNSQNNQIQQVTLASTKSEPSEQLNSTTVPRGGDTTHSLKICQSSRVSSNLVTTTNQFQTMGPPQISTKAHICGCHYHRDHINSTMPRQPPANLGPIKASHQVESRRDCQVSILVNGGPLTKNRTCHCGSAGDTNPNVNTDDDCCHCYFQPPPQLSGNSICSKKLQVSSEDEKEIETASASQFTIKLILANILHRYVRMMPLMMAIIGLCSTLLRYLGDGPLWNDSTLMYDGWCRKNWWINAMFLHNFVNRENMCLSHSWYSAVDLQLFLVGQLILFALAKSRKFGLCLLIALIFCSQLITISLTIAHHLPAVPLVSSVNEQTMNLYYGEIYIKPYCRASPYLIGILLAYLMRTTKLGSLKLKSWQIITGWSLALSLLVAIILAMQPAMNGVQLTEIESALYSALSRPLWALATGWMIFACITNQGGPIGKILSAKCFVPLSRLTYPAFLIHPIVMALFYGSRQASFHFSHYLMLYLILGNIVITYASAFILAALFELPLLSIERTISRRLNSKSS